MRVGLVIRGKICSESSITQQHVINRNLSSLEFLLLARLAQHDTSDAL
jgi:hypothetical protein